MLVSCHTPASAYCGIVKLPVNTPEELSPLKILILQLLILDVCCPEGLVKTAPDT